jgi:hypothetical protein
MTTSTSRQRANFLRLVEPIREPDPLGRSTFARSAWQNTLFARDNPSLLVVVIFEELVVSDFLALLSAGHPRVVFDLRRVPRFDIAHLNRRLVFDLFLESRIEYIDLSGALAEQGAVNVIPHLAQVAKSRQALSGPVVLLVDRPQSEESELGNIIDVLPTPPGDVWDVLRLPLGPPERSSSDRRRDLVFVSHANPEDNGFASWLSSKLAIAGYQVWSDVTKLVGGELFWNDIETAIRHHAAKVIIALSRLSQTKSGVLDEIDLAIRVERGNGLEGFVVPLRIDDLPFIDVRANLARRNIIDFHANWALGLSSLLKTLERDGVPRTVIDGANTLSETLSGRLRAQAGVAWKSEILVSNWLPLRRLPDTIDMFDIEAPIETVRALTRRFGAPAFPFLRLVGVFGDNTRGDDFEVDGYVAKVRYRVPIREFLSGSSTDLPGLGSRESRNHLVSLLRQSWDLLMATRGLHSFETASGAQAWYLPQGLIGGDKISFVDENGIRRRKQLVGWSDRRQVFWHAAFEARPVLVGEYRVVVRQHVIFTKDGRTPIGSTARMHALRRSFCKNWWNDRWRDLLQGFLAWLSEDGCIRLPVGPSECILLDSFRRFISPVSPEIDERFVDDEADRFDFLNGPDDDADEAFDEELDIGEAMILNDDRPT